MIADLRGVLDVCGLWYAITGHGRTGLHYRAQQARTLAQHAHTRLIRLGWDAYRHPHAFTVVLRTPPQPVLDKWVLASENGWSHLITMPGVTADTVNAFLDDMTTVTGNSRRKLTSTARRVGQAPWPPGASRAAGGRRWIGSER